MTGMPAIEAVVDSWRSSGVALNRPATSSELAELAGVLDGVLTPEVERFYGLANGMPEGATDGWHISFWSVERVLRERDVVTEGTVKWTAFADFLMYSHCLRLGRVGRHVFVSIDGTPHRYSSLEAFFERYLAAPSAFGLPEVR
jgi:hypothetical protein